MLPCTKDCATTTINPNVMFGGNPVTYQLSCMDPPPLSIGVDPYNTDSASSCENIIDFCGTKTYAVDAPFIGVEVPPILDGPIGFTP